MEMKIKLLARSRGMVAPLRALTPVPTSPSQKGACARVPQQCAPLVHFTHASKCLCAIGTPSNSKRAAMHSQAGSCVLRHARPSLGLNPHELKET